MYLGIINGWEREHFRTVAELGLQGIEFCINHNVDSAAVLAKKEEILKASKEFGVRVGSIGRWGMQRIGNDGAPLPEALAHDKNLIELASFVGCPVFNVGCNFAEGKGYYENCGFAVNYFKELLDYARPRGVKIAVYNCDWANFVYGPKAWSYILGALPDLGIKYDTSHAINRRSDYLKEIADWGDRFYHVHIKGNLQVNGESYDDSPAGLDTTKWSAVMSLLYIKNYDGMLSIEPHSHNWRGKKGQWGIRFTIDFMRPFIIPEDFAASDNPYMP